MNTKRESEFLDKVRLVSEFSRLKSEDSYTQHGNTSCLLHSVAVAYYSYKTAKKIGGKKAVIGELIRGALLHDYFLYDWHTNPIPENGLHGFSHPYTAWQNASRDFELTEREENIIRSHMFPLTLTKIPRYREAWIVTAVDKVLSLYEVFARNTYKDEELRAAYNIILEEVRTAETAKNI